MNSEEDTSFLTKIQKFDYRPIATITKTLACCISFGIIFISIGIVVIYYSSLIKEVSIRYDDICFQKECFLNLTIYDQLTPPINVYYELDNFYQNHRKFLSSVSLSQLTGKVYNKSEDVSSECKPIVTVKDLGLNTTFGKNITLPDTAVANPCGLFAKSFFNDTYKIMNSSYGDVPINETNISWNSDRDYRFKLPENAQNIQWINVTDEHFMVWMRPAATSRFRKLWGRIETDLNIGNYTLNITNNYNVSRFKGKKSIVLSTSNFLGGRNSFMGTAYLILGIFCLFVSAFFAIAYKNKLHYENKEKIN